MTVGGKLEALGLCLVWGGFFGRWLNVLLFISTRLLETSPLAREHFLVVSTVTWR